MIQVIVDQGQWLRDAAIQYAGTVTEIFAIALANGLSITDTIEPGSVIDIPNVVDAALVKFLSDNNYVPSTTLSPEDEQANLDGISYMKITQTFIVR